MSDQMPVTAVMPPADEILRRLRRFCEAGDHLEEHLFIPVARDLGGKERSGLSVAIVFCRALVEYAQRTPSARHLATLLAEYVKALCVGEQAALLTDALSGVEGFLDGLREEGKS